MDEQTNGRLKPGPQELRQRSNNQGCTTNTMWDLKVGVESYKGNEKWRPMKFYIKRKVSEVKAAVREGKPVVIAIDYGVFNNVMNKTGDPNFRGGHAVEISEQKRRPDDNEVMWLLYDSLDDQRRTSIPAGPRWVPRWKVIKAMLGLSRGNSNGIYAGVLAGGGKR